MAGKRYQVFVSSTFRDLQEERWEAVKALMTLDCIVAGMESFPAVDEEQFEYIKEIIDDCDYYLLILGGRYGSLAPDGVGYTEKEYEYALSKDIKIIALVQEAPEALPPEKRETDAESLASFNAFREKVCANRLVSYWNDIKDIQKDVALGMAKAMKKFPAIGWVRADTVATADILREINELRKERDLLLHTDNNRTKICIKQLHKEIYIEFLIDGDKDKKQIGISIDQIFKNLLFLFHTECVLSEERIFNEVNKCLQNDINININIGKEHIKIDKAMILAVV